MFGAGASDEPVDANDDSILYAHRNFGRGVPCTDHSESVYDFDKDKQGYVVRRRPCPSHPGEFGRYVCKDHEEVLCPKCLMEHRLCDFQAMGPTLTHQARHRFRQLLTHLNARFNLSTATLRKVTTTTEALDVYMQK